MSVQDHIVNVTVLTIGCNSSWNSHRNSWLFQWHCIDGHGNAKFYRSVSRSVRLLFPFTCVKSLLVHMNVSSWLCFCNPWASPGFSNWNLQKYKGDGEQQNLGMHSALLIWSAFLTLICNLLWISNAIKCGYMISFYLWKEFEKIMGVFWYWLTSSSSHLCFMEPWSLLQVILSFQGTLHHHGPNSIYKFQVFMAVTESWGVNNKKRVD